MPHAAIQVRPTLKMALLMLMFISSHAAATMGATIQNAATALPVKVAARTDARVKPSMTLTILPLDIFCTVPATRRMACVRLNPSEITNMLEIMIKFELPIFPRTSPGEMQPVMRNRTIPRHPTVPTDSLFQTYPAITRALMTRQIISCVFINCLLYRLTLWPR